MDSHVRVLVVAAEAVPFTKVGGLAEFAGALPKALRALGVDARLMIPRYSDGARESVPPLKRIGKSVPIRTGSSEERAYLFSTDVDGVPVYLVYNDQHFGNRERVYGFNDDPQRFMFFSRAAIQAIDLLGWKPDVVHANDWHTAPIPVWLDVYGYREQAYSGIASLYTIHDFLYQGIAGRLLLSYGHMVDVPHLPAEPPGKVNWTAQGIAHADVVSTVSPAYAHEILESDAPEASDLRDLVLSRRDRFFGILSGIDTVSWNPGADDALAQTFDVRSLAMRAVNKTALQRELRLPTTTDQPLVGIVTRLDPTKGLALLAESLARLLASRDCQFVLLGAGDDDQATPYHALQSRYPRSVRTVVRFDDRLARRIFAGCDIYAVPSQRESVSVALMSAMHYGAIPVVHAVGGLSDTVLDVRQHPSRGTGFVFDTFSVEDCTQALQRATRAYGNSTLWKAMQTRCMQRDFSWTSAARAYLDLYDLARRSKAPP